MNARNGHSDTAQLAADLPTDATKGQESPGLSVPFLGSMVAGRD
jgi:hypothetical protein